MRTLQEIEAELALLRAQMESVQGTECEVYTRIVGYYRSLRNWNKGKKEEYRLRVTFDPPKEKNPEMQAPREVAEYRYFYRKTCPNCPPVKEYVSQLPISGKQVDVDTEEGLSEAKTYQILSTPTVLFFDRNGRPIIEAHTVDQLEDLRPRLSIQWSDSH
ncbi:MAG: thiol reductase thioredoxin [Spirochaetes bacterium]|nr:thiol reductase thioredoxin [Spirochaetota bacterium]